MRPTIAKKSPAPHMTLQRLMFSHDVKLEDVAHVFGNPHLAREVLEGKREISKGVRRKNWASSSASPAKLFAPGA